MREPLARDILNAHPVPFILQHDCSLHVALSRSEILKVFYLKDRSLKRKGYFFIIADLKSLAKILVIPGKFDH